MRKWLCPPSRPKASEPASLSKLAPQCDQFADPLRGFADDHFDNGRIAQVAAGGERVGDVILETVFGIEHARDAPLGVAAVRLLQAVLGDDQHA